MKSTRAVKGVLLFPGAGTGRDQPSLVRLESSLTPLPVRRADFPYRKAGRRAPDRPPVLLDAVRTEATDFAAGLKVATSKLVLGGRSMGGRMCTMAAAGGTPGDPGDAPLPVAGLVLICYPLHPPGKPESLRVEHLPRLTVPCLFISGTRDAFGTPEELEQWTATIPGPVTQVWLAGKGHDLKGAENAITAAVTDWLPTVV
ncbi:MAG: dienelactone hydrolase [Ilumatobacteraceae bacterium]|nr:dienelactone hydrolase [Ilumatobacteraceae bacterium]